MADHPPDQASINDRQNEVLRLEMIKANLETRLVGARIALFKAQGGILDFDAHDLPRKVGALIELLDKSAATDDVARHQITLTKSSGKNASITTTGASAPTTSPQITTSPRISRSPIEYAMNQDSFISLKISPARYRDLVQQKGLPSSNTTLVQGPDCSDHPRWSYDRPNTHEGNAPAQPNLESVIRTDFSQPDTAEKVKVRNNFSQNQVAMTQQNIAAMKDGSQAGSNTRTTPVAATQSQSVHPHSASFDYGRGPQYIYNHPQQAMTPYPPGFAAWGGGHPGMTIPGTQKGNSGVSGESNLFLQLAALQRSSSTAPEPNQQKGLVYDSSTIPFPAIIPIGWQGMKKNNKAQNGKAVENVPNGAITAASSQKRPSSVELVDQRPKQRRRIEPDRVMTPPLNEMHNSRMIDENYDESDEAEESLSDQSPGPHSTTTAQSKGSSKKSKKTMAKRTHQRSKISSSLRTRHTDTGHPETQAPMPHGQTHKDNELELGPSHTTQVDPDIEIRDRRKQRAARRRQPGYTKSKPQNYLSPTERNTLEMRFCANVTKIIGSKICVSMPPLPYDQEPIFDRLRSRFRSQANEPLTEDHYRNVQDFVNDATRILGSYVALGHCPECPFLKTSNARVMCYRMRLQSILDARIRELKDAIFACEVETEADDHAGRCKIIDEWFWEEDFEEAGHWQGS